MSRPTKLKALPSEPALDEAKVHGAMQVMQGDAQAQQAAEAKDTAVFAMKVGAVQAFRFMDTFLAAAKIRMFSEIKKSKKFKDLPIALGDGSFATAKTFEEFCQLVFGVSYQKLQEAENNLAALGEQTYEAATRLGIGRNDLRLARSLPEDEQKLVAAALENGSKPEVSALIEKLVEARQHSTELEADLHAERQLGATRNRRVDELKLKLKRIAQAKPDEALAELQKEATAHMHDALGCIRGNLRAAFIALAAHADEHGASQDIFMAGLAGQVKLALKELVEEFGVPDVHNAADLAVQADADQWFEDKGTKPGRKPR